MTAERRRALPRARPGRWTGTSTVSWTPTTGRRPSRTGSRRLRSSTPRAPRRRGAGAARGHRRRRATRRPGRRGGLGWPAGSRSAPDAGSDAARRHFLRSQAIGFLTSRAQARRRADRATRTKSRPATACVRGDSRRTSSRRRIAASKRWCRAAGRSLERYVAWREAQAVPVDRLEAAIASLAEDLQEPDAVDVRPA